MKKIIISFELVEQNDNKYLFIPTNQWMFLTTDEKSFIFVEQTLGVRPIDLLDTKRDTVIFDLKRA